MTGDYDPYAIGGKPSDEGPRERVGASVGAGTSAANEQTVLETYMAALGMLEDDQ